MRPVILLVIAAHVFAADGNKVRMSTSDEIIPQVVSGSGWTTSFTFVSAEDVPIRFPISFFTASGQPWSVRVAGTTTPASQVSISLPPRGAMTISLSDVGQLEQGWAMLDLPCCPDVGGYAVFRQRIPGRPDFEAVVPISYSLSTRSVLAFDETDGFSTGIAMVNTRDYSVATVTIVIRDENGERLLLDQVQLPRLSKQVFSLAERFREAAGKKGTVEFIASPGYVAVLGLRFNPSGAFTSMHALEP